MYMTYPLAHFLVNSILTYTQEMENMAMLLALVYK